MPTSTASPARIDRVQRNDLINHIQDQSKNKDTGDVLASLPQEIAAMSRPTRSSQTRMKKCSMSLSLSLSSFWGAGCPYYFGAELACAFISEASSSE